MRRLVWLMLAMGLSSVALAQAKKPSTGTVSGTGSSGQCAFWSAGSILAGDPFCLWDNTNKHLTVGTVNSGDMLGLSSWAGRFNLRNNQADAGFAVIASLVIDAGTPSGFASLGGAVYGSCVDYIGDAGVGSAYTNCNGGYFTAYGEAPANAFVSGLTPLTGYAEVDTGGARSVIGVAGTAATYSSGTVTHLYGEQPTAGCYAGNCTDVRAIDAYSGSGGGYAVTDYGVRYQSLAYALADAGAGTGTQYGFNIQEDWSALPANTAYPFYYANKWKVDTAGSVTANKVTVGASGIQFSDATTLTSASSLGGATVGAFSGRPAPGHAGALFIGTDSPVSMYVDNGSAWHPLILGQVYGTQPKVAATFTAQSQGSTTLTDRKGSLHYHLPSGSGSITARYYTETLSASATLHVEAAGTFSAAQTTPGGGTVYPQWAIFMRASDTGRFAMIAFVNQMTVSSNSWGTGFIEFSYWSSDTSRTAASEQTIVQTNGPVFLRLERSGSNILGEVSNDNQNWTTVGSAATATIFSSGLGTPDQVGIGGLSYEGHEVEEVDFTDYSSGT